MQNTICKIITYHTDYIYLICSTKSTNTGDSALFFSPPNYEASSQMWRHEYSPPNNAKALIFSFTKVLFGIVCILSFSSKLNSYFVQTILTFTAARHCQIFFIIRRGLLGNLDCFAVIDQIANFWNLWSSARFPSFWKTLAVIVFDIKVHGLWYCAMVAIPDN